MNREDTSGDPGENAVNAACVFAGFLERPFTIVYT